MMFGKKAAIRKYIKKLPDELSRRYGGSGPYTRAQVEKTVHDLRLSKRHLPYAYLLFCNEKMLEELGIDASGAERMANTVRDAARPSASGLPLGVLLAGSDSGPGDSGGGGDIGGDAGGGCP